MVDVDATLTQTAQDAIMSMIRAGELADGAVISERNLAERLGLSRTPVREALGRLEGQKFLRRSGRTLLVSGVALQDVLEILAVRRLIEAEAARIAAMRIGLDEVAQIRSRIESMADATHVGGDDHWEADEMLHMAIARASGNGMFQRLIADCRIRTRMFGMEQIPSRFAPGRSEHLAILDALAARDSAAAGRLMSEHIENAKSAIVRAVTGGDAA